MSAPPCSSQPSTWGPRKQRMALSDTHPIRQALRPYPVQLRMTSKRGVCFPPAQDGIRSVCNLGGAVALPQDNPSGWSSPSRPPLLQSSLGLHPSPAPGKEPALGELTSAIEGQDGRAGRLAWWNSSLFNSAPPGRAGPIVLAWESGQALFLDSCRISGVHFHFGFLLGAGLWNWALGFKF